MRDSIPGVDWVGVDWAQRLAANGAAAARVDRLLSSVRLEVFIRA